MEDLEERVERLEDDMRRLTGPHIELVAGTVGTSGEVTEGPHAEVVVAEGPPPGETLAEWIAGIRGSPGIVVDPGEASGTPCIRYALAPDQRDLVFSKGIIGVLDEEQEALYCQSGYIDREPSEQQKKRFAVLPEAAKRCSAEAKTESILTGQDPIDIYYSCLARELKVNGVEP